MIIELVAGAEAGSTAGDDFERFSFESFEAGHEPLGPRAPGRDVLGDSRAPLRLYLPLLLGGFRARQRGEVFLIAHLAQTLDGRIACTNGHSQWISNQANLRHAHRLRALHDAVMVGARTVEADDPKLTVRHVAGDSPRRVVLNASGSVVRRAAEFQVARDAGSLFICHEGVDELPALGGANEVVHVAGERRLFDSGELSRTLTQRGIHSVFLEGGGRTISNFLQAEAVDVLHLHVAPRILGSGVPGFDLPEVTTIDAGHQFTVEHFAFDGELLFECRRSPAQARG